MGFDPAKYPNALRLRDIANARMRLDGANGSDGATGPAGNDGANGIDGATGPAGNDGANGIDGATGPAGNDGANGIDGATGPAGNDGATGPAGNDGAMGPAGANGSDGATGADGQPGTVLAFADFYALMPVDNPATLAPSVAVAFPNDGPTSASDISRISPSTFSLSAPGIYLINFQVSVTEAGQLAVASNGTDLPMTVVGRATGASQIVGMSLIAVSGTDTIIEVRNPAANAGVLTMTPYAGAASPVSAHLTILRLQ